MKYLGIDYGSRKVGLAVGDGAIRVAVPLETWEGGADIVERVVAYVREEGIETIVVGVAVPEGAQRREHYERTLRFCDRLRAAVGVPVELVDEQFTSTEARRVRHEAKIKVSEDALAAMILLQAFFDEGRAI